MTVGLIQVPATVRADNGARAVHIYAEPATYPVLLIVTDDQGGVSTARTTVTVKQ